MRPDPYALYMTKGYVPSLPDVEIKDFSISSLAPLMENGAITKSVNLTVREKPEFFEAFIFSSIAKYESSGDGIAAAQLRIIDEKGDTLYYSPVYEIGHKRDFYRREWRVPPVFDRYVTLRLSLILDDGVKLYFKDLRIKHNYGFRERDFGIRYHGHGGCTSAFGFQLTAEVGFTSCITIPKFTKDGVPVCFHDDTTVIDEALHDDGTHPEIGGKYDKPVSELTYAELCELSIWRTRSDVFSGMRVPTMDEYFEICSSTGMQPIFSVHPALTHEQWGIVKQLLKKHRLLEQFRVKSGPFEVHKPAFDVLGDDIAGYILLYSNKDREDPVTLARLIGLDQKRHNITVEHFNHTCTDEKIRFALDNGFPVSIACMKGGISGIRMREYISLGVTEFTVDRHCSMGLSW